MMTTTYNLSPEEKQNIFASKYRNLEFASPDQSIQTDTPTENYTPQVKQEVQSIPESEFDDETTEISNVSDVPEVKPEKKETTPKVNQVSLGYLDKMFMGTLPEHYIKASNGETGLYQDKPDPRTMQGNVFKRAQKYSPNKITNEIESLDFDDENERYLKLLQHLESASNYKIVNSAGYRGLYQFGKDALKSIRMKSDDYMQSSANQHVAALKLKDFNLNTLGLNKYIGKSIGGIKLTANGLAAGQHLGGAGSVKKFVESNGKLIQVDGNNVPITVYLSLFQ